MSNPDNFIDEVAEEVRRDRLFQALRRYGWILAVLVIGALGYVAWAEWRKSAGQETAEQFGDALTLAMESGAAETREASLSEIAARESGLRAALSGLMAAEAAIEAGDRAGALARLATIAGDTGLPEAWRDLVRLRQVALAGPDMAMAERQATVDALARPGSPYRPLALEQAALLAVERGETETAVAGLRAILQEPDVTAALRRRVTSLLVALGAAPEAG